MQTKFSYDEVSKQYSFNRRLIYILGNLLDFLTKDFPLIN